MVDAVASAAAGKKHKVARLQLAAAYATAEFGLLAAVARQLQSYGFSKAVQVSPEQSIPRAESPP